MKLAILVIMLLSLCAVTYLNATVINQNFDGDYPPSGWDVDSVTRVDNSVTEPNSAPYCAYFDSYDNYLRSPLIAAPEFLAFSHKKQTGNCDFMVQISYAPDSVFATAPRTTITTLWAAQDWHFEYIDLSMYQNIYVWFVMVGPPPRPQKMMFLDDFSIGPPPTTPVELTSFTAAVVQLQNQDAVQLHWTTESETMLAGYNVFRNTTNNASTAIQVNFNMIAATNSSGPADYHFTDAEIEYGTSFYWLQSNDLGGTVDMFGPISVWLNTEEDPGDAPPLFPEVVTTLLNAYPNPFRPASLQTNIPFILAEKSNVKMEIFNHKGQLVWTYEKTAADAGMYNIRWNGKDNHGKALSSGVYYCRMSNANYLGIKKVVLFK